MCQLHTQFKKTKEKNKKKLKEVVLLITVNRHMEKITHLSTLQG